MDACNTVKHLVPDANRNGQQIECWISYKPGSIKLVQTPTETKVRIYARLENNKGMIFDYGTNVRYLCTRIFCCLIHFVVCSDRNAGVDRGITWSIPS